MLKCVICNINNRSKRKHIKDFKICGTCYSNIIKHPNRIRRNNNPHTTHCYYCGIEVDHYQNSPTCSKHRHRWIREQKRTEEIKNAIKNTNTHFLITIPIREYLQLGFNPQDILNITQSNPITKKELIKIGMDKTI